MCDPSNVKIIMDFHTIQFKYGVQAGFCHFQVVLFIAVLIIQVSR